MNNERDTNGRFSTGNQYGKGRPAREVESLYLSKLSETCSPERWTKIVGRAVTDAEDGNAKAREWLASYLIGRPLHRLDIAFGNEDEGPPEFSKMSEEEFNRYYFDLFAKHFTNPSVKDSDREYFANALGKLGFRLNIEPIETGAGESPAESVQAV